MSTATVHNQLRSYLDDMPLDKSRRWADLGRYLGMTHPDTGDHPLPRDEWEAALATAWEHYPLERYKTINRYFAEVVAELFDRFDDTTVRAVLDRTSPTNVRDHADSTHPVVHRWLLDCALDTRLSERQRMAAVRSIPDDLVPYTDLAGCDDREVATWAVRRAQHVGADEADAARVVFGLVHGRDHEDDVGFRRVDLDIEVDRPDDYRKVRYGGSVSVHRSRDGAYVVWQLEGVRWWNLLEVDPDLSDEEVADEVRRDHGSHQGDPWTAHTLKDAAREVAAAKASRHPDALMLAT